MRKSIALLAAVLLFGLVAAAQDFPRGETFLGFTYLRMNSATNVPAFSANGGGGQFVLNFNRWIGAVADVGAVHNGNIGGYHLDSTFTSFMFGPRVTIRNWSRVQPYGQMLWGGMYASTSAKIEVPANPANPIVIPPPLVPTPQNGTGSTGPVALRASAQQTAFAMALGGGLDIKIKRWLSFRPIGLDWQMSRLQNLRSADDNNQHHLRYTTGFNFSFGGAQ
jgi:hypothetical protein